MEQKKYYLRIVCCECGKFLGTKTEGVTKEQNGKESSTYCSDCLQVVRESIKNEIIHHNAQV